MKFDVHFRAFAKSLETTILGHGDDGRDRTERQKAQVETLIKLEKQFREALIRHHQGPRMYKKFISYITKEKRNILAARPFFRERQEVFASSISNVIRKENYKAMYRFNINYTFIAWVMRQWKWPRRSGVSKLAEAVRLIREEMIEMNTPLAISRAKIFYSKTPRSHLEFMDVVQIAVEGLISAIDKFVLPYSPVFRAVIIGRATGNMIEAYTETLVHFYPSDKKKIYRANKQRRHFEDSDFDGIASAVNEGIPNKEQRTTSAEIQHLMAAASTVSSDANATTTDGEISESPVQGFVADPATRPDVRVEENEALGAIYHSIKQLTLYERKFLAMKGIDLP